MSRPRRRAEQQSAAETPRFGALITAEAVDLAVSAAIRMILSTAVRWFRGE